jgi:hypothetical protein
MAQEPLVDLLLVRLGREEEKERVSNLLVTSLQMTEADAKEAVENSPAVLKEAVPMAEARDIQKKLYPFIDLLPRIDETTAPPPPTPVREVSENSKRDALPEKSSYSDNEDIEDGEIVGSDYNMDSIGTPELDDDDFTSGASLGDYGLGKSADDTSPGLDEGMILTTASDEMLQIERCHVCGRTPPDGEKLAPCRTCGALTCRDCFDRTVHVCEKCASEGKVISTPLHGTPDYLAKHDHNLDLKLETPVVETRKKSNLIPRIVIPLVILVCIAAAFYFIDPMHLFSDDSNGTDVAVPVDTATVVPDSTGLIMPDTLDISVDTALVVNTNPLGLASLSLPDTMDIPTTVPPITRVERFSSSRITVLTDELDAIALPIAQIAVLNLVSVDMLSLVRINSGEIVLLVSVLHPEDNTNRYRFLNSLAAFFLASDVDQLVFYYRENRFQNTSVLTYTSDIFAELQLATSPQQFQALAGSLGGEVWELVSGQLQEVLTNSTQ